MTPKPGDITEAEYVELPKRFNLEKFDACALVVDPDRNAIDERK
jgi:hypothetical protein